MNTIAQTPPAAGRPLQAPAERLIAGVRGAWRRSVLLRGLAWAPALFAASAVLLVLLDLVIPLRAILREVLRWLPLLLGGGFLAWSLHRIVRPPAPRRFALLAEERDLLPTCWFRDRPALTLGQDDTPLAPDRLRMRVWERGGMITLACGSGACAAVVATARRGLTERRVTVVLDGGELGIDWRADGVWMTGPTALVFEGRLSADFLGAVA